MLQAPICTRTSFTNSVVILALVDHLHREGLGPNQICTLFGAEPGSVTVSGSSYLFAGYGISVSDIWRRNLVVLLVFLVVFQLTQMLLIEYYPVCIVAFPSRNVG